MRVAYVLPWPELGGGNKVIFQHARLLRESGCEVTVLGDGAAPRWTRLDLPYHDYAAGPIRLPEQDLVVATYWTTVAVARRLALGPLAHFCQGYEGALAHLEPHRCEIEAAYRSPLPTLAVAPHLCELLARRFARECKVVPPPLDPLFVPRRRMRPRRRPWIAVPGIFEAEVKGVPTALAAVRRLRASGCRCRLLRFSTLPLSAGERALLAPDLYLCAVPPEQVARALRRCDLLLLPSRAEEGFGLPLLEAMASKVPAVASRIPSTEFIGGAARLVPVGDEAAFAAAARELLADGREWRRARAAGQRAAERFRPALIAPLLADAIRWARERALSAGTPGAPNQP
ncbi:MAG TPA: glycosyltransferase [Thermoanaerobaculia bacterium]|nr:glycosyltransferase [Thermoanaerobaculia bacterium]